MKFVESSGILTKREKCFIKTRLIAYHLIVELHVRSSRNKYNADFSIANERGTLH